MDNSSNLLEGSSVQASEPVLTAFVFSINGMNIGLSADLFCEVVVEMPCAFVPNAPDILYGIGHLRGGVVPIYQLYTSLKKDIPRKKTMFFMGRGDQTMGLLIDQLPKAQKLMLISDDTKTIGTAWVSENFSGRWLQHEGKPLFLADISMWLEQLYNLVEKLGEGRKKLSV